MTKYARMLNSGESGPTDTIAAPPPPAYYVIVGRGIAAWYNHASLISTEYGRKRLGSRELLQIGHSEDWKRRERERMGQFPRMLDFFSEFSGIFGEKALGFDEALTSKEDWLESSYFAEQISKLEKVIRKKHEDGWRGPEHAWEPLNKFWVHGGFVGVIEHRSEGTVSDAWTPDPKLSESETSRRDESVPWWPDVKKAGDTWEHPTARYRLSVFNQYAGEESPKVKYVYADKIDICSGLGRQPRWIGAPAAKNIKWSPPSLEAEFKPSFCSPTRFQVTLTKGQRRIMSGNDFIGDRNNPGETIVIFKGGAVGAQSVQSALGMPLGLPSAKHVFWVHNSDHDNADANVPGSRNLLEVLGGALPVPEKEVENFAESFLKNARYHFRVNERDEPDLDYLKRHLHQLEHYELAKVSLVKGGAKVRCEFSLQGRRAMDEPKAKASFKKLKDKARELDLGEIFDHVEGQQGNELLLSITADRLVWCIGQDLGNRTEWDGTPNYMTKLVAGWQIITTQYNWPDGLTNEDEDVDVGEIGCIRILGSCMTDFTGFGAEEQTALRNLKRHHGGTLPPEALAAEANGINPALTAIRRANKWNEQMGRWYPIKLHTASSLEFQKYGELHEDTAQWIDIVRSASIRGYAKKEFLEKLSSISKSASPPKQNDLKLLGDDAKFTF